MSSPPSTSTSASTPRKCFNLFILVSAFLLPIYTSRAFSIPSPSSLSSSSLQQQKPTTGKMSPSQTKPNTNTNMLFILDFDATITTSDTISALFQSALKWHTTTSAAKGEELRSKLEWVIKEYTNDLASHQLRQKPASFKTTKEFVDYQRGLRELEKRSFARVGKSGILGGIGGEGWKQLGRKARRDGEVVVRDGWEEFWREIGGKWGVVSVNFCGGWVRGILDLDHYPELDRGSNVMEELVEVSANSPNEKGEFEGEVMVSSDGKRDAMRSLVERLRGGQRGKERVVYVGDSATDVECLLDDGVIGIVMTREDGGSGLLDILRGVEGVVVRSLGEFGGEGAGDDNGERIVYFAKDFRQLVRSALFT